VRVAKGVHIYQLVVFNILCCGYQQTRTQIFSLTKLHIYYVLATCFGNYLDHNQDTVQNRSSFFCNVRQRRWAVSDVSGQPIGPIFKSQAVQEEV
jgi:hypothetical protein